MPLRAGRPGSGDTDRRAGHARVPAATFNEVLNFMVNEMLETATLGGGCFWCEVALI